MKMYIILTHTHEIMASSSLYVFRWMLNRAEILDSYIEQKAESLNIPF